MFSINAHDYKIGTLHVGADGNIYRCSKTLRGQGHWWELHEKRDLSELITRVMGNEKLTVEEKINALTEQPEGVGCNFFGSCQYYSAWQVYYLCHLAERYEGLNLVDLGIDCDLGENLPPPGNRDSFQAALKKFREDEMEIQFDGSEAKNIPICMDNRWMLWFGVGCPDEAHPLEVTPPEDDKVIWLPTQISDLPKKARKRVRKFQKRKLRRLIQWLENVKTEEVFTEVGEFEIIRAEISKDIIKVIKRRIRWKQPELPYYPRSKKDEKKFDAGMAKAVKAMRNGKKSKAQKIRRETHERFGLGVDQLAWDKMEPKITDPMRSYSTFYIPIEAAPTAVAKLHLERYERRKDAYQTKLNHIESPLDWLRFVMKHSDMWAGIPKVFTAVYPNATVKCPIAKSPGGFLLNDWSTNYSIGLQCYMLKMGSHIEKDEDFECANS